MAMRVPHQSTAFTSLAVTLYLVFGKHETAGKVSIIRTVKKLNN